MKNFFITFSFLVAGGSIFYYYVVFLPQHEIKSQQDINAIRSVIAPTAEQQKIQQQQSAQAEARWEKAWNDYMTCETAMGAKAGAYLQQQCPADPDNPLDGILPDSKRSQCTTRVWNSAEYKKFTCPRPF